jgi:hypothetical protein
MRRESTAEREAWTALIEDRDASKPSKYHNERSKSYASKYEAQVAQNLDALFRAGKINNLQEQVSFVIIEGKGKLRPIIWVADFVYFDLSGVKHICDAKGFRTPIYRLKKRMMALLHSIEIEEI